MRFSHIHICIYCTYVDLLLNFVCNKSHYCTHYFVLYIAMIIIFHHSFLCIDIVDIFSSSKSSGSSRDIFFKQFYHLRRAGSESDEFWTIFNEGC